MICNFSEGNFLELAWICAPDKRVEKREQSFFSKHIYSITGGALKNTPGIKYVFPNDIQAQEIRARGLRLPRLSASRARNPGSFSERVEPGLHAAFTQPACLSAGCLCSRSPLWLILRGTCRILAAHWVPLRNLKGSEAS